eukprot:5963349-Ditylum_brightwellii.AAC.1
MEVGKLLPHLHTELSLKHTLLQVLWTLFEQSPDMNKVNQELYMAQHSIPFMALFDGIMH